MTPTNGRAMKTSEREFQAQVIDLARMFGWRCAHFRTALSQSGRWLTPVQADGAGFPDLVLTKGPRLVFAELKADRGIVSRPQAEWLSALAVVAGESPNVTAVVWKPRDWDDIVELLKGAT